MCHYCDVRMPDGCGFELDSKHKDFELMLYPNGNTRVIYDDCKGNVYRDDFYFNYCPMCGKPLHGSKEFEPGDEMNRVIFYLVRDDCGEYNVYTSELLAKETAEEVAANVGVADMLRVKLDTISTCEVRCCWDDE